MLLLISILALEAPPTALPRPVTIVAHRGLAEGIPENTLAAFHHSVKRGIAVIELDVRATQDGHLVILHDETLDRTTDCNGRLAELSLARVKACDAGWPSHPGERIPTLTEALEVVRGRPIRLLLDIKPGVELGEALDIVRDHKAEAKVILGLRRSADVATARAQMPSVPILAFMPDAVDAAKFASAGAHIIRLWSDWVEADPALVDRTRALGPEVWVMVGKRLPARKREWRDLHTRMIATGAEGLITDRPDLTSGP
ncbi:MAG TPA: glycerophosphodiester phosphodiesterase family protein [Sphingomicrobium sp.]|nr:glycerophosphodiester phosphodiesterase family protein [Sphingomicrobium sp.]